MPISLSVISEFTSLLVAIFSYKKLRGTWYVYAIPFLFFVLYAEAGAIYHIVAFSGTYNPRGNTHIYLWVSIIETIFYSRFFWEAFKSKVLKKTTESMAIVIIASYLFLFFFSYVFVEPYFYLMALNGFCFTILSCIYFYRLFINAEEENALSLPDFWMAVGIFTFFSGIGLSFVLHKTLEHANIKLMGLYLYNIIPQVLSIILYGCFITAFILCRKRKTI
ncbi:hypothetical protein [Asinibacterium sp. OR53]|uniref:hypothetical protein n=1 Tax=Asinibacterium sp. OR53 TaxID=925409 RepID=UPI0004B353F9|nr:hypothetical protein [Asinibacterium sp. OR53]